MKKIIFSALVLALAGCFFGCKKNNDKKATCKISSILIQGGTPADLIYDSKGRLSRLAEASSGTLFEYAGASTTVTHLDSNKIISRTIISVNSDGLAINARFENDATGASWSNDFYEYNGTELSRSTTSFSDGSSPSVTTYSWSGGDMVRSISGTDTTSYGYYTDKPKQDGDYFSLVQTLQGYESIRNKNLLRSVAGSTLNYDFGTDGKIRSLSVVSGNTISFLDYTYECN